MWESKAESIDINYNLEHLWFDGINGQHVLKPTDIRKWEEGKTHKLVEKHFPRIKAEKMLSDLSSIALEWAKNYVRQRQTFKLNTKGENLAPLAFQHDPDGTWRLLAAELRSHAIPFDLEHERPWSPLLEPIDEEDGEEKSSSSEQTSTPAARTDRAQPPPLTRTRDPKDAIRALSGAAPSRSVPSTPEVEEARKEKNQRTIIKAWIDDPDHPATEECRHVLELYAQLTDSEFSYVADLQTIYDETRCFFLQWILGKEIKELVNSARISAVQTGDAFTWTHAREETLRTLTDVTLTARFLAVARLRRLAGVTAKLWISQVYTRKALLEDSKLGSPIFLPETLYLELLVGQMSAQETTVFDGLPSIGDDLLAKDARGIPRYTLDKIKKTIDACSNPPYFRGVKTPITDLLDAPETKAAKEGTVKEKRDQVKTPKEGNTKTGDKAHLSRRPEHEQPAKFPEGLKRPNLEAVFDGKKIASEFQRQLFDDIKRGNCSRCHKGGHNRRDCKDPKARWEEKFDKEKTAYWTSVLNWQQKAAAQKGPGASTSTTPITTKPPTLHVKITEPKTEQRFTVLAPDSDDDEPMQQFRTTMDDPDDDDDDFNAATSDPVDFTHDLDEGNNNDDDDFHMAHESSYEETPSSYTARDSHRGGLSAPTPYPRDHGPSSIPTPGLCQH